MCGDPVDFHSLIDAAEAVDDLSQHVLIRLFAGLVDRSNRRMIVGEDNDRGVIIICGGHFQGYKEAVELSEVDCVARVWA